MVSVDISPAILSLIVSVTVSLMGVVAQWYRMERRVTALELKMDPLWEAIRNEIPKMLIKPHTPEIDRLLKKGISEGWKTLTEDEAVTLQCHYNDELTRNDLDPMVRFALAISKSVLQTERKL